MGQKFPHVFPSCAVTRARAKQLQTERVCEANALISPGEVDVEERLPDISNDAWNVMDYFQSDHAGGETTNKQAGLTANVGLNYSDVFSETVLPPDKMSTR